MPRLNLGSFGPTHLFCCIKTVVSNSLPLYCVRLFPYFKAGRVSVKIIILLFEKQAVRLILTATPKLSASY